MPKSSKRGPAVQVKPKNEKEGVQKFELAIHNLVGELESSNVSNEHRQELKRKISACKEQFKGLLAGKGSAEKLEKALHETDLLLAQACILQAQHEIPKQDFEKANYQALENVTHELKAGHISPIKARHEVKTIMRPS